ncbi:hypothetical protein DF134_19100 [Burkholderia stagnalis]|uniref:hypothetical protein n=1 Tax=Burkholderia stagnalis TaxID=1503054 RepID=UPI000F5A8A73|nr:hypothetical protein [Burkholderia stagnalis]RQQ88690.1 hypothetical protein DF134_19100 [Burkholderia stagnalis]
MKTIVEPDLKEAAIAGRIKDFIVEEVETGYILLTKFDRSNVEHILFTQRKHARIWKTMGSLIEFIVQYKPELPEVRIRLRRRSNAK